MCCSVGVTVLGGANPGEFVVVFAVVVVAVAATCPVVCARVLKPVLKPVLKAVSPNSYRPEAGVTVCPIAMK